MRAMVFTPLPTGAGGFVSYAEIATTPHIGRGHSTMILPAIVRECTVRFGHAMRVFPLLDRIAAIRSDAHQSELQPLMRISYAGFCMKIQQHTTPDSNPSGECRPSTAT